MSKNIPRRPNWPAIRPWNIAPKVEPSVVGMGFVAHVKKQANQHEHAKTPVESKATNQNNDADDPSN